jgi:TRAP transporter TAXI family solute receptor
MKWKRIGLVLAVVLALSLVLACAPGEKEEEGITRLRQGGTHSGSAYYVKDVGIAQIVNKYVPDVRITVFETGGAHDNIPKITSGYMDYAASMAYVSAVRAYNGLDRDEYKANPPKMLRIFIAYGTSGTPAWTRVDTGLNSLQDFQGKKFYFGLAGSSTEFIGRIVFDALGITVDPFLGGYRDAFAAFKDGRIDGMLKDTSLGMKTIPAELLEIHTFTPVKAVCYSEEDLAVALKAYPGMGKVVYPVGYLPGVEGAGMAYGGTYGCIGTDKIAQDVVYKITKAMDQHWEEYLVGKPGPEPTYDPVGTAIIALEAQANPIPLHAGFVQYAREDGYTVAQKLIPPEYKG